MADVIKKYHGAQDEARQAQTEPLTRVRNDRVGAYTLVHCTDDIEEAAHYGLWDSVHWWYQNNAEYILEWELPNLTPEEQAATFPLLKDILEGNVDIKRYTDEDMIIIGTPEECLEKILRYEGAGIDQLLAYQQFGMLPHDKVMRSIELLGTKIIPELEARGHRVDYSGLTGGTRP